MFAGHVGAGLALGRAERRVNVGALVLAALLLDLVLWLFVLAGWETVVIPTDYATTHQPEFTIPYSHGLVATLAWSVVAGACAFAVSPPPRRVKMRAAGLIAMAVASHWLLDALVHTPGLPLAGEGSWKVGLGLWQRLPLALLLEALLVAAGLGLFLSGAQGSRGSKIGISVLSIALLGLTVAGMTVAPPPPSGAAMASSSLVTLLAVGALYFWLGRRFA